MQHVQRVWKTAVLVEDGIYDVDTIEVGGARWLVPEWVEANPRPGCSMPVRVIGLTERYQAIDWNLVWVGVPVPKSLFEGHTPPGQEAKYVVVERPALFVDNAGLVH